MPPSLQRLTVFHAPQSTPRIIKLEVDAALPFDGLTRAGFEMLTALAHMYAAHTAPPGPHDSLTLACCFMILPAPWQLRPSCAVTLHTAFLILHGDRPPAVGTQHEIVSAYDTLTLTLTTDPPIDALLAPCQA